MHRGALALLAASLSAALVRAQPPPQVPGTFRSAVTMVPVDVRVLDRNGKPVTDLTADEFTIFEDGVRQQIRHFSRQALVAAPLDPADPDPRLALRQAPGPALAPQAHRIFLIVFGRGRLQHPARGIDAALRFVRERLLPQDRVAVLAYNRATDFTTDHEKIAGVIRRYRMLHEIVEAKIRQLQGGLAAVYGSREIPDEVQGYIDQIFLQPRGPGSRRLPPGRIVDFERIREDTRMAEQELSPLDAAFDDFVAENLQTINDLGYLYAGIEYLRYIDGEKHLIFVTEAGLFLPREENDRSLAALATSARVAIDTIQTGGVYADHPAARRLSEAAWRRTWSASGLRLVSEQTGGMASLYSYADKALARIDEATRFQYLLGYYPSNGRWDGKYRRISITVNRPGVTVLYRRGYHGTEQIVPFDRRKFLAYSRIISAARYGVELRDIPVAIKSATLGGEGLVRQLTVAVTIPPSRIVFQDEAGVHTASLDMVVYWGEEQDRVAGELWQTIDLRLDGESYARFLREGATYTVRISVRLESPKVVKVVLYDPGADIVGSALAPVRVTTHAPQEPEEPVSSVFAVASSSRATDPGCSRMKMQATPTQGPSGARQNTLPPSGTSRSGPMSAVLPVPSGTPSTRTSELNGPICLGGKLTTASTSRLTRSAGRYSPVAWAEDVFTPRSGPKSIRSL